MEIQDSRLRSNAGCSVAPIAERDLKLMPGSNVARFKTRLSGCRRILWAGMAIGCLVLFDAPSTWAQDLFARDSSLNVLTRPRPGYDPLGVRAGAFLIHPEVTTGVTASDDIRPAGTTPTADILIPVQPHVAVNSDWGRHAVSLDASGTLTRYASHPNLDSDQYAVSGSGTLDVRHDLTVTGQASQARILLPTTSDAYLADIQTPLLYDETRASVGAVEQTGRFKLSLDGVFESYTYLNGRTTSGAVADEHFRDRKTYDGGFRADYAITPDLAVFVQETLTRNSYNRASLRNETMAETLVGPNFQINNLVTAELGVGYLSGWFSDPGARTLSTLHGQEKIIYFATPLITLTFTGHEGVIDSGLPTSPAYFNKNFELEADYELLRNLILSGSETVNWNDYKLINRHDGYFSSKFSVDYLMNRGLDIEAAFDHIARQSTGASAGKKFDEDVLSLAFRLKR